MMVEITGINESEPVECHCPATGRIGGLDFHDSNIPCLVSSSTVTENSLGPLSPFPSPSKSPSRRTKYTVEAISFNYPPQNLEWTGINQNKANRYVEYFLRTGMFNTMLYPDFPAATAAPHHVEPEVQVGDSRIDFEVDESILIEVKTPLIHIPCENHPKFRLDIRDGKFDSANRIVKHFRALADIMEQPERRVYRQTACSRKRKRNQPQKVVSKYFQPHRRRRCIFLICQLYDAEPFRRPPVTGRIQIITDASMRAKELGVEFWQVNLRIDTERVDFLQLFRLPHDY